MPPDTFLGIGMNEAHLAVHKFSRMADRHMPEQIDVAAPLVSEDQSLRVAMSFDERNQRLFRTIGNDLQKALATSTRDATQNPLPGEHTLIPLRDTGKCTRSQAHSQTPQHAIELLAGATVHLQHLRQIGA